jgi:hypothetical protein
MRGFLDGSGLLYFIPIGVKKINPVQCNQTKKESPNKKAPTAPQTAAVHAQGTYFTLLDA